jgi:hypothetical protein
MLRYSNRTLTEHTAVTLYNGMAVRKMFMRAHGAPCTSQQHISLYTAVYVHCADASVPVTLYITILATTTGCD